MRYNYTTSITNQQKLEIARNFAHQLRLMVPEPLAIFVTGSAVEEKTDPFGKIDIVVVNPLTGPKQQIRYIAENLATQMGLHHGVMMNIIFRNTIPPASFSNKIVEI